MSLNRAGFVPIPAGAEPGFDHADVYRPSGRMYVAHTGADRVDVIDCRTRSFLHSLPDLPGVAGVLIDQSNDSCSLTLVAALTLTLEGNDSVAREHIQLVRTRAFSGFS